MADYLNNLSWRTVIVYVYACLGLIVFDFAWRIIESSFITLAATGLVLWLAGLAALLFVMRTRR